MLCGLLQGHVRNARIDLQILVGIIVEGLARLLVDALGPVDVLEVGLGNQRLTGGALIGVEEAVARRMGDERALLPVHRRIEHDVGADFVIVPHVAGGELEVPVHLAVFRIIGDGAVGVEVVTRAIGRVEHGHRIAGAPDGLVGQDVIGARHPHGAAAGLPCVVLVLPGFAARLAGGRNDEFLPGDLAGLCIKAGDPVTRSTIATRCPHDNLVADGQRRSGQLQIRLVVHVGFPDDLARVLVGRNDAGRAVGDRDHQIAPKRGAAIGQRQLFLAGVHAPDDATLIA